MYHLWNYIPGSWSLKMWCGPWKVLENWLPFFVWTLLIPKLIGLTKSRNGLPYVSPSLKRLMRKRDRLHARKDPRYYTIKHEVQKKLCSSYWQYVEEIITPMNDEGSMGANKQLWGLFKHSKSDGKGVPPLKHQGNLHVITNAAGKANVLNCYFQSVFTSHVLLDLKQLCQSLCNTVFYHARNHTPFIPPISIPTAGIAKLLDNLKPHRAAWPDGLSPMVLWELFSVIASALQKIFSKSLSSHQRTGKKPW